MPEPRTDWGGVVGSVTRNAIQSFVDAGRAEDILAALLQKRREGLSFSELRQQTKLNSGTLSNQLRTLKDGGLVENLLQRREKSREYSYYRATPLGEIVMSEFELFSRALERQVIASSPNPAIAELVGGTEIWNVAIGGLPELTKSIQLLLVDFEWRRPGIANVGRPKWGSRLTSEVLFQSPDDLSWTARDEISVQKLTG